MSTPAGEAPTAAAAPGATEAAAAALPPSPQEAQQEQPQSDTVAVPPSAPTQTSVAPPQQPVSGGSGHVAQAGRSHTVPITPTSGAPNAGRGPPVQRQAAVHTRDTFAMRSLGPAVNSQVKKARVLMVGAGGIGCELLKNIVLLGFSEIHVVDLDTIDLSNLNRQFLFRHEHIKKSKALVAKETAQRFNPKVKIEAHHANIKESHFNVEWFKGFNMVFNALDNMDARRHVNKMCLAADVPLIESGTTGFNGQVQVIKKGVTACYDCTPKDAPKSFPVCTIRSTPSQPIHCIVWGKSYLLNEMFGASEDASAFDHTQDQDNAEEIVELKKESEALKKIRESVGSDEFPELVFNKVFKQDIERLRSMEDMWKSRKPPHPLDYKTVMSQAEEALAAKEAILQDGQKVWTLEESLVVFNDSLQRLSKRILDLKKAHTGSGPAPIIEFDKDDDDTLDFVAASANIRSTIFNIDRKSRFDTKQMAGNIIPAIATTNAIVAGLCVLQAFKVLKGEYNKVKETFLSPFTQSIPARIIAADRWRPPNPDCPVCSVFQTSAYVDLKRATLSDLVEDFLRLQLGYGDKELAVRTDAGILYDPDETENLSKKLSDLGITPDTFITIFDEDDAEPFVNVVLNIQPLKDDKADKPVQTLSADKLDIPKRPKQVSQAQEPSVGHSNGKELVEKSSNGSTLKRSLDDEVEVRDPKKAKVGDAAKADDDVLVVDDGDSGAIMVDDD
ncbi:ThiF family protein [Coniella lustricola]|uniref:Ubiquitin-activating enzyme E1-like n=1 Tax=Coniella lustricola TaxID=2025994 RepID=A0A2T3AIE6_9PEZI|nr:ThiF family protein [Coniella lustricola]